MTPPRRDANAPRPTEARASAPAEGPEPVPSRLFARIAHDIRSPLGLVRGALDELMADLGRDGAVERAHLLSLATRGVDRLERLANRLSTAARLERGLKLDPSPWSLPVLVDEVAAELEAREPRRGVTLDLDLQYSLRVRVDRERFCEALRELISEARRRARSSVGVRLVRGPTLIVEDDGDALDPAGALELHLRDGAELPLALPNAEGLFAAHGLGLTVDSGERGARFVLPLEAVSIR